MTGTSIESATYQKVVYYKSGEIHITRRETGGRDGKEHQMGKRKAERDWESKSSPSSLFRRQL